MAAKSADYIPRIHNSPELALAWVPDVSKHIPYNVWDDNKLLIQINTVINKLYGTGKWKFHEYKNYKSVEYTGETKVNGESRNIN